MNDLTTAREALLAEALGQVATLVERLERLASVLDASREAIIRSGENATAQLGAFEMRMAAISDKAQTVAVRHIAQRTNELTRSFVDAQTRAMEEAARDLFRNELGPALQRLATALQHQRDHRLGPVEQWLIHAAVAVLSSALTWAAAAWLWTR